MEPAALEQEEAEAGPLEAAPLEEEPAALEAAPLEEVVLGLFDSLLGLHTVPAQQPVVSLVYLQGLQAALLDYLLDYLSAACCLDVLSPPPPVRGLGAFPASPEVC